MGCGASTSATPKITVTDTAPAPQPKPVAAAAPAAQSNGHATNGHATNGSAVKAPSVEQSPVKKKQSAKSIRSQLLKDVQEDGSVTCVERVQAALDAIAAEDKGLNCCVELLADSALAQAAAADVMLGEMGGFGKRRILEGVPILVKANIDVQGTTSSASMPGLKDWKPETTAPVVKALTDQGAIVVGKTNMPEAAFGGWGYSPLYGVCKNARNTGYTTGGSSSGTASGLAAGYVRAGLGSDTGGSLRTPAECCGIVGLRPSLGRYSGDGVVPCDVRRDTAGPMAQTVSDLAVFDAVITGTPIADYTPKDLSGLTVAMPADFCSGVASVPGLKQALDIAQYALEKNGATCKSENVDLRPVTGAFQHSKEVSFTELGMDDYLKSHGNKPGSCDDVLNASSLPGIAAFFQTPVNMKMEQLANLKKVREENEEEFKALKTTHDAELQAWTTAYAKYFEDNGIDVIMTPCSTVSQPAVLSEGEYKAKTVGELFKLHLGLTILAPPIQLDCLSALPVPSLALPTKAIHEVDGGTLPAGVLLWGKPNGDVDLIKIAMALEEAMKAP